MLMPRVILGQLSLPGAEPSPAPGALAPGATAGGYPWTPPPVGLRWATRYESTDAKGQKSESVLRYQIREISGDRVTYEQTESGYDSRVQTYRLLFTLRYESLDGGIAPMLSEIDSAEAAKLWPLRKGSQAQVSSVTRYSDANGKALSNTTDYQVSVIELGPLELGSWSGVAAKIEMRWNDQYQSGAGQSHIDVLTGVNLGGASDSTSKSDGTRYVGRTTLIEWQLS